MGFIWEGFRHAFQLIIALDPEVYFIAWTSLRLALTSCVIASAMGIPLGFVMSWREFPGHRWCVTALNTALALPTVVVGLFLFGVLSRQGPLGSHGWLFTPTAIVIGQSILALPIITAMTLAAFRSLDTRVADTARSLGASRLQTAWTMALEARFAVVGAIIAGFGRVIGEVGVSMMLGGNIYGLTRTLTTAIALETSKGEFGFGIALGIILLAIALVVNAALHYFQAREA